MKEGITQSCAITSKEIFRCFFLFLLRVGSGGEKENGEKNRRAFALGKGFGAEAFVFGSYLLFLGERTERAEDLLRVGGKSRGEGVCAVPVRWCCWGMFGAREGVGVRKRGKRKRPPLLPLLGREFLSQKEDTGCYFPISSYFS